MDVDAPHRPFCSARCKAIDLGGWLEGRYRISRPVEEEDLDAGAALPVEGDPAVDDAGGPRPGTRRKH
jgi:hypothetical protein